MVHCLLPKRIWWLLKHSLASGISISLSLYQHVLLSMNEGSELTFWWSRNWKAPKLCIPRRGPNKKEAPVTSWQSGFTKRRPKRPVSSSPREKGRDAHLVGVAWLLRLCDRQPHHRSPARQKGPGSRGPRVEGKSTWLRTESGLN